MTFLSLFVDVIASKLQNDEKSSFSATGCWLQRESIERIMANKCINIDNQCSFPYFC